MRLLRLDSADGSTGSLVGATDIGGSGGNRHPYGSSKGCAPSGVTALLAAWLLCRAVGWCCSSVAFAVPMALCLQNGIFMVLWRCSRGGKMVRQEMYIYICICSRVVIARDAFFSKISTRCNWHVFEVYLNN